MLRMDSRGPIVPQGMSEPQRANRFSEICFSQTEGWILGTRPRMTVGKAKHVSSPTPGNPHGAVRGKPYRPASTFASIASQIMAAMSLPPKAFTCLMPVGDVTLISVR